MVLVGSSSTGKTRACWQAVQELAKQEWRLWHPFDPTRAEAALEDLHRVGPRTVVWLNEAQHSFGNQKFGAARDVRSGPCRPRLPGASFPDTIGRQLQLLVGETAEHCAWLYCDADHQDEARGHWGEALTTATMLHDAGLQVLVSAGCVMTGPPGRSSR